MNLMDIVQRNQPPEPWAEGEKIPWNEPGFSQRMLHEHLSQAHDAASRRLDIIDRQVRWIHHEVLGGKKGRVLDLGCGPGLYTQRLACLGHTCTGIDFSPASVVYAREQAASEALDCTYVEADIRDADYGADEQYDLVMLIFGELNVFRRAHAGAIIAKAYRALKPGGSLLLEPHTFRAVHDLGMAAPSWYTATEGLFSAQPHLVLQESYWHEQEAIATQRYYLVDAASGSVTRHADSMQAYTKEGYRNVLQESGFQDVTFHASLTGNDEDTHEGLMVILAAKPA